MSEEFFRADGGDELLEIERFEVRGVFEPFFFVGGHCGPQHGVRPRAETDKAGVRGGRLRGRRRVEGSIPRQGSFLLPDARAGPHQARRGWEQRPLCRFLPAGGRHAAARNGRV